MGKSQFPKKPYVFVVVVADQICVSILTQKYQFCPSERNHPTYNLFFFENHTCSSFCSLKILLRFEGNCLL